MAEGKQIKITATIDEPGFQKATRYINEMTSAVSKLVAQTQRLSQAMGGGGGGVSSVTPAAGAGTASIGQTGAAQMGAKGGGIGGGVANTLARGVTGSAALFDAASKGTIKSFDVMQKGLRDSVTSSDRYIKQLQRSLEGLEKSYERVRRSGGDVGAVGAKRDQAAGLLSAAYSGNEIAKSKMIDQDFMPQGRGGFRGAINSAGNWFSGGGTGSGAAMNAMGMGGLGSLLRMAASPMGAVAALVTGGLATAGAMNDSRTSNLGFQTDGALMGATNRASVGGFWGGTAQAIAHGDMARLAAFNSLTNDPSMKAVLSPERMAMMKEKRNRDNVVGAVQALKQGSVSGAARSFMDNLGAIGTWAHNTSAGDIFKGAANMALDPFGIGFKVDYSKGAPIGQTGMGTQEIARARAEMSAVPTQLQDVNRLIEAKLAEDPEFAERMNTRRSGVMGTLAMARASGVSNRLRRDKMGNLTRSGLNELQARFAEQGIDDGEGVAAMQEMAGAAGQGFKSRGGMLVNIKAGGLSNAASLFGIGAQFNGGGAKGGQAFLNAIQGRIGRGGVDINAASQITGMGTSMMSGGGFMGSGGGLMSTLLDAGGTGTTGGDMRMVRAMAGGVGSLTDMMSGGIDPLQKALNASSALAAAPNSSYATKSALMGMDPATAIEAVKSNRVPPELASMGVTMSMLQKYVSSQNSTAFSRVTDNMLAGTTAGGLVSKYKETGDLSQLKGKSRKQQEEILRDLAPALVLAGGAKDNLSALGRLRIQASTEGYLKGGKGRGSGSAAAINGTQEGANVFDIAKSKRESGEFDVTENGITIATAKTAAEARKILRTKRAEGVAALAGSSPDAAITNISQALTAFVNSLKAIVPGGGGKKLAAQGG